MNTKAASSVLTAVGLLGAAIAAAAAIMTGTSEPFYAAGAILAVLAVVHLALRPATLPLIGLIGLCLVAPTRVRDHLLSSRMANLPGDPIVRASFQLVPGTDSYYPEAGLVLVSAGLLLYTGSRSISGLSRMPRVGAALITFVLIATLNVIYAVYAEIPLQTWIREYVPIACLLLVFPLAALFRHRPWTVRYFGRCMSCLLLAFILHSLYVSIVTRGIGGLRLTEATPYNTLPFAPSACMAFLAALVVVRPKNRIWQTGAWLALCAALYVVVMSATRIALIATLAGSVFAVACTLRSGTAGMRHRMTAQLKPLIALSVLVIIGALIFGSNGSAMQSRFAGGLSESSASSRFVENEAALQKFRQSPILGEGLGSEFRFAGDFSWESWTYVHNAYLYYLANLGVIGFVSWLALCFALVWSIWQNCRKVSPDLLQYYIAGGSTVVVLLIYCAVQASFRSFQNSVLLASAIALCASSLYRPAMRRASGPSVAYPHFTDNNKILKGIR